MGRSRVAVSPALRLGDLDPRLASPATWEALRARKAVPPVPRTRAGDGGSEAPAAPAREETRPVCPRLPGAASLRLSGWAQSGGRRPGGRGRAPRGRGGGRG